MNFLTKIFALIGLVFLCFFVFMNLNLFLNDHPTIDVFDGDNECQTEVKNQSRGYDLQVKYIFYYCHDEIFRKVEIAKYLEQNLVDERHFLVEVNDDFISESEDVFPIIISDEEVIISLSENVSLPYLEHRPGRMERFDHFTVSLSELEITN